jgi:AcrR family transcriptional regulator
VRPHLLATSTETPTERSTVTGVTGYAPSAGTDRVIERRRAVALARHYREYEGLSIRQIADRLGRSPATVKAYFYDPPLG